MRGPAWPPGLCPAPLGSSVLAAPEGQRRLTRRPCPEPSQAVGHAPSDTAPGVQKRTSRPQPQTPGQLPRGGVAAFQRDKRPEPPRMAGHVHTHAHVCSHGHVHARMHTLPMTHTRTSARLLRPRAALSVREAGVRTLRSEPGDEADGGQVAAFRRLTGAQERCTLSLTHGAPRLTTRMRTKPRLNAPQDPRPDRTSGRHLCAQHHGGVTPRVAGTHQPDPPPHQGGHCGTKTAPCRALGRTQGTLSACVRATG